MPIMDMHYYVYFMHLMSGWAGGQCHICSSYSYNPNLTLGPSGPCQIGNYTL